MNERSVLTSLKRSVHRMKCFLSGELYFHKYDKMGAYHWQYYYDRKQPLYVAVVDAVCEFVPSMSKVLDLGCGDGLIANVLAEKRECTVTGIDSHPSAVSLAKQKNRNSNRFLVQSAYNISLKSRFDVVLAVDVFEHLRKPELMLSRARVAMKDNGIFIVTTPLVNERKQLSRLHVKEYTKEEFHRIVEQFFLPFETRLIEDSAAKANCYIICCRKKEE